MLDSWMGELCFCLLDDGWEEAMKGFIYKLVVFYCARKDLVDHSILLRAVEICLGLWGYGFSLRRVFTPSTW
jgi:hypothetical protein